jgi:hypothetical protein
MKQTKKAVCGILYFKFNGIDGIMRSTKSPNLELFSKGLGILIYRIFHLYVVTFKHHLYKTKQKNKCFIINQDAHNEQHNQ